MASVVLLNRSGGETVVTSRKSFIQLVYGQGYRPKTGDLESNYRALAGGAAPSIDELAPVLLTDLDDSTSTARKRLEAQIDTRLDGLRLKRLTQVEHDALTVKDPDTLYVIRG